MGRRDPFGDGRRDILPIERVLRISLRTRKGQQRRHHVDMVDGLVDDGGAELAGPVHNRRQSNTPLPQAPLASRVGSVGAGRFAASLGGPFRRGPGPRGEHGIGRPAIVGGEEDEGVFPQAPLLQGLDNSPDLGVESRDHGGVGALLGVGEDVAIGVDLGLRSLVGGMRGERREVEEERLGGVVLFNQPDRLVANQIGVVALFLQKLSVSLPVDDASPFLGEVIDLADEVAVKVLKAAVLRPVFLVGVPEVPLPHHVGVVAHVVQRLGEGPFRGWQPIGVAGEDHQGLQSLPQRVPTGHQCRPSGSADRQAVIRLKSHSVAGQRVDVRSLDAAATVTQVGIAKVIREDDHNVGPLGGERRVSHRETKNAGQD